MKLVLIKNRNNILKATILIMFITIISTLIYMPLIKVKANIQSQPSFEVKIDSASPNPALVGEDIKINATITPKDFQSGIKLQKKEIVLVLDVSGSMNEYATKKTTKIAELKKAANNFLTRMSTVSDLKIGIVAYSSEATINPTLVHYHYNKYNDYNGRSYNYDIKKSYSVSEESYSYIPNYNSFGNEFIDATDENIETLKGMVDGLEALGGTNTGEGLRKAEYMLENGDQDANRSIVFMSDGQPTFYSVYGKNYDKYYTEIDNTNPPYYGTGSSDIYGYCKEYAEKIGETIRENRNNIFSIGYGLDNYGNDTMKDIHNSMGGLEKNFFATDSGAIDGVFDGIADKIINSYNIYNLSMNMNFNSDEGFSLNIGGNTTKLNNIVYTREEKPDNNGNCIYKAEPVKFSFIIKGSKIGEYKNVFKNSNITFSWQGNTITQYAINNGLIITINDKSVPIIKANIVSQIPNPAVKSDNITLKYEIKPESFEFNSTILDDSVPKDVVFALDISNLESLYGSGWLKNQSTEIKEVEEALVDILKNNAQIKNVKYGMVTYSDKVYDRLDLMEAEELAENIENIRTTNGKISQIKKGEDAAKRILDKNGRKDSKKYVVIISLGHGDAKHQIENDVSNGFYNRITLNLGDIDSIDEIRNLEIPFVFNQIRNTIVVKQVPSYTFKTKLKFNLGGKFDIVSGLNSCTYENYDVETPEFDVVYNLNDGKYFAEPIDLKLFTIKIKNTSTSINNLDFGPGIVLYTNLSNKLTSTHINPYNIKLQSQISILNHGLYEGMKNNEPSINETDKNFNFAKGSSINLGANMSGSINNYTNVRLEIPKEVEISNTIKVFVYDNTSGNSMQQMGVMKEVSAEDIKRTYKYEGQEILNKKILILYSQKLPQSAIKDEYVNTLYVPDGSKDVKIKVTEELPDLF